MDRISPRHSALFLLSAFKQRLAWSHVATLKHLLQDRKIPEEKIPEVAAMLQLGIVERVESLHRFLSDEDVADFVDYTLIVKESSEIASTFAFELGLAEYPTERGSFQDVCRGVTNSLNFDQPHLQCIEDGCSELTYGDIERLEQALLKYHLFAATRLLGYEEEHGVS